MGVISVKDLKKETFFDKPVYLDDRYILLTPEIMVSGELINELISWEFREVRSEGSLCDVASHLEGQESTTEESNDLGQSLLSSKGDDSEKTKQVLEYYRTFTNDVDQIFTKYVTKGELNSKEIMIKVKQLCEIIKENRKFILRIQDPGQSNRNYLVSHSVKTTILAIVLGSYLKLQLPRLIELGTACLLHEIGMIRLPPQLYMNDRPLTPQEKKNITAHPLIGFKILKELNFPLSISLVALEHHERLNGTGYPRQLQGDRISLYSRIIQVACTYDAVTSSRPYKEAKDGYTGMLELLKNPGKQYDEQVIKALVYSLSIYPIGSYVLLSNGMNGQVVDINPDNPRFPVVMPLGKTDNLEKRDYIKTTEDGIKIVKPLSKNEIDSLNNA